MSESSKPLSVAAALKASVAPYRERIITRKHKPCRNLSEGHCKYNNKYKYFHNRALTDPLPPWAEHLGPPGTKTKAYLHKSRKNPTPSDKIHALQMCLEFHERVKAGNLLVEADLEQVEWACEVAFGPNWSGVLSSLREQNAKGKENTQDESKGSHGTKANEVGTVVEDTLGVLSAERNEGKD